MILFMILALIVFLLVALVVFAASVGGATFIVLFGDVIVCIFIVILIMKALGRKKRK